MSFLKLTWLRLSAFLFGRVPHPTPAAPKMRNLPPDPYSESVKLSPNRGGDIIPEYIILHHSGGSYLGGISWIRNPESKVSYHYLIDPISGNRTQLVWDSKRAWHAGKSYWNNVSGLNGHSIGIAFAGDTNKRVPAFQEIDSVAHKCVYLMNKFGIPKENILTHAMISPGRKDDCSGEAYWLVINRINEIKK